MSGVIVGDNIQDVPPVCVPVSPPSAPLGDAASPAASPVLSQELQAVFDRANAAVPLSPAAGAPPVVRIGCACCSFVATGNHAQRALAGHLRKADRTLLS